MFYCVQALLGLRFLLNRAKVLEENGSKFSLSGMQFMLDATLLFAVLSITIWHVLLIFVLLTCRSISTYYCSSLLMAKDGI